MYKKLETDDRRRNRTGLRDSRRHCTWDEKNGAIEKGATLYTWFYHWRVWLQKKARLFYLSPTSKRKFWWVSLEENWSKENRMHLLSRQADFGLRLRPRIYSIDCTSPAFVRQDAQELHFVFRPLLFLYRRSTGSEDSAASFHAGIECTGAQTSAFVWKYNFKESDTIRWDRAGVFPW